MAEMKKLNGCYRARVENNGRDLNFEQQPAVPDPENRLRIQVRVLGVHSFNPTNKDSKQFTESPSTDDIIPISHLPWAEQATPLFLNGTMGTDADGYVIPPGGSYSVPSINTWVWVFFEQGDPMSPIYFGGMLRTQSTPSLMAMSPNISRIVTKAGHYIEIDDAETDGVPSGSITINFLGVKNGQNDDVTTVRLSKDSISLSAKYISIAASVALTATGPTEATINGLPIVSSYSNTVAVETINMGKGPTNA